MAESNKAVLRGANAAIDRGDIEGFLACCTDDLEWCAVGGMTLRGKAAVRRWMATAYAEPPPYTVARMIEEGDFVTALGDILLKDEHGLAVRHSYCDVWRLREGKLAALQAFVIAGAHASSNRTDHRMFDHVKIGVSDYAASKAFFLAALAPLGVTACAESDPSYGIELCGRSDASLCLFQAADKPAPLHLAFVADTREQVDAFHAAALQAGGTDNGAPGLRPHYHADYYAAFVIGPDGHNVEAVCHRPQARPAA